MRSTRRKTCSEAPNGKIILPPIASCCKSALGNCGVAAAIMMESNGAASGSPRFPSPCLSRSLDRRNSRRFARELRLSKLRLKHGDGNLGLPEAAPFDSIIIAAATPQLPKALLQQLAMGGRMILPFGASEQVLRLVERIRSGYSET